jgi:hypothetical protein
MPETEATPLSTNHRILLKATAGALALPEMLCLFRRCRRGRACRVRSLDTSEPCCLSRLWPWQRALFDELYGIARNIHDGRQSSRPSEDPERRELEEAAIAIVRASLPFMPEVTRQFEDWCRRYYAPPAAPVDTAKLLAAVRAELAHDKMLLEMADLRGERQRLDP